RSLQWLAVGLIGGSLGSLPQSLLVDRPWLICSQVTIPAVMICATVASVRQRRARTVDDGRRPAHRRFSVLPYAAVVAVDALRLSGCVRARDTVGRLGGDEFIVVLDDIDPAGADLAVERMLAALTTPVVADGHELLVRASIGVADGGTGDDADELLRRADIAMYAAKNDGGGGFARYRPDLGGAGRPAPLGAELRQAIADGQFFLVY